MGGEKPLWEHEWDGGLRMLQMGVHTHLISCRAAIPLILQTARDHETRGLVVEMTDGTHDANADFRRNVGFYYDLVKANVERIVKGLTAELENLPVTAVGVTPGWLRSEKMLEKIGGPEANWREACAQTPGFARSPPPTHVGRGGAPVARQLDDAHVVIRADFDYRASVLRQFPETFSVPARYSRHMMIVADLAKGDPGAIEDALEAAWQLQRSAD